MYFEGTGTIYTYNYMYSNAYAISKEVGLTTYGKNIAVVTFSAFMLESYFNHVCQIIFDVSQRVDNALDSLTNEDLLKMKALELPAIPFNEKVAIYKGYTKDFDILKKSLRKKVNSKHKKDFDKIFSENAKSGYDFEYFDRKYRFSPRLKCKAILKSLFSDEEYQSIYEKVDITFAIRDSLAHGRTQKVSGKADVNSLLTCHWQENCSSEQSTKIFEQATEIVKTVDHKIESQVILGNLQDQFGAVRNWQPHEI